MGAMPPFGQNRVQACKHLGLGVNHAPKSGSNCGPGTNTPRPAPISLAGSTLGGMPASPGAAA